MTTPATRHPAPLILASGSHSRRQLLSGAGVRFEAVSADVDERALRDAALARDPATSPPALALMLARAKADDVSARHPQAIVIGADQMLALGTILYEKPIDMAEARTHLIAMRGRTHQLHGGLVVRAPRAAGDWSVWTHTDTAHMTMRAFTPEFLEAYLSEAGPRICQSVGAYQLEGLGLQLFERIDGDYFSILGLSLLPLIAHLRTLGVMPH